MQIVNDQEYASVAFPLIGSGSGNRGQEWALELMLDTFSSIDSSAEVILVRFKKA